MARVPVALAKSRTWRGLTTTTGSAAAARAATNGSSRPPVGARQTSQGEGLLGPGHGHVVEPTRSIDVLGLPNAIPAAVQHHHVVELQAPGAVGGVQEQSQFWRRISRPHGAAYHP